MYLITVFISKETKLYFKVLNYTKERGKLFFIDARTGMSKEFPDDMCAIEEVGE